MNISDPYFNPLESYIEYKNKVFSKNSEKMRMLLYSIKDSSLNKEDKTMLRSHLIEIINFESK